MVYQKKASDGHAGLTRRSLLLSSAGLMLAGLAFGQSAMGAEGDWLTANIKDLPNFDILGNGTSWVILALGPCYNGLVTTVPGKPEEIVGELAESWTTSGDGKSVTFKLRDGVTFHDGVVFTSADVKHTFDVAREPPAGIVSTRKSLLSGIERIDAPDPLTVVFRLKRPLPFFLALMATGWMVVLPKHIMERDGDMKAAVVGTGPFQLKEYQRGVRLDLIRNANYFRKDLPAVDGVTFFVADEPSTLDAYFRTGQIMMYNEMSTDSGLRFEKGTFPGVAVQRVVAPNPTVITINGARAPWNDIRVRQAASYAVNRADALNVLEHGQGRVGGFLPPGRFALSEEQLQLLPGYSPDHEANVEKSRALLEAAGFKQGFESTILVRNNADHEKRAIFIQDSLKKIGINLKLEVQESAVFFENFAAGNFDLATQGGISYAVNDPDVVFGGLHTKSAANLTNVFNDEIDKLYAEQMIETDFDKRVELAQRMDQIALTECGRLVLLYHDKFVGVSDRVSNYYATSNPDDASRLEGVVVSS